MKHTTVTIYHNPRCSKSRQTLALLENQGITPEIVLYLDTPPDAILLQNLLNKLNMSARDLLRRGEDAYKNLLLNDISLTDEDLILAMAQNPSLIERPIVVCGEKAALGRPPERVLSIL